MANIPGTNVASTIAPFTTEDQFPTHDAKYGKGGQREVATIAERDAIPSARLTEGCTCYVAATEKTYRWKSNAWVDDTPEIASDASDISYTPSGSSTQTTVAGALDSLNESVSGLEDSVQDNADDIADLQEGAVAVDVDTTTKVFAIKNAKGQDVGTITVGTGTGGSATLTLAKAGTSGQDIIVVLPTLAYNSQTQMLEYVDATGTHVPTVKLSNLTIKYVGSTDPSTGDWALGDLILVGSNSSYELKVYDGNNTWQPLGSINNVSLQADQVHFSASGFEATDVQGAIEELDSKQIVLQSISASSKIYSNVTSVGQYYYNTTSKRISRCTNYTGDLNTSTFVNVPFKDGAIYVFENKLYRYDNSNYSFVPYTETIEGELSQLKYESILFEQGGISAYGVETNNSKRLRTKGYISGTYTLKLPTGFVCQYIIYYNVNDLSFSSYDNTKVGYNIFTITEISGKVARLVVKKNDNDATDITVYDLKQNLSLEKLNDDVEDLQDSLYFDVSSETKSGKVNTDAEIGTEISITPSSNDNLNYIILECKEGDKFRITGKGGSNARLWCFVDTDNEIVSHANANLDVVLLELIAPIDGHVIFNVYKDEIYKIETSIEEIKRRVLDFTDRLDTLETDYAENVINAPFDNNFILFEDGGINTSGKETTNQYLLRSGFIYGAKKITMPIGYRVRNAMLYNKDTLAFVSYVQVKSRNYTCSGEYAVRITVQKGSDDTPSIVPNVKEIKSSLALEDLSNIISNIKVTSGDYPIFSIEHELRDVSSIVDNIWQKSPTYPNRRLDDSNTIHDKVQGGFDDLVTEFPDYVSKDDAYTTVNLQNPSYAGLNGEASGSYLATPSYNTYIYKFVRKANDSTKRKLLIVSGVHGNEKAGPANTYILAYSLCHASEPNLVQFLNAFDIYIIPCVNGYGQYHNQRWNANGVDINRNFPCSGWVYNSDKHTGDSAGSEAETQMIMAWKEAINPDFVIDHHNYDWDLNNVYHLYTHIGKSAWIPISRIAFSDCVYTFIKELPNHFGNTSETYYKGAINRIALITGVGTTTDYFTEQETTFACTLEVCSTIMFGSPDEEPGEPVTSSINHNQDILYGDDVFAVADYTLRTQLYRYGEYVLKNT